MSTFNSQSTDSTRSSVRFDLDESDNRDILVYHVRSGYKISSERQLCQELDKEKGRLRCSRKPIGRGTSRVDVQVRDLVNEPERSQHSTYPNQRSSIASVGLPSGVYWRRLLLGHFKNLYIVSQDSSSSLNNSTGSSANTSARNSPEEGPSPANTWNLAAER